MEPAATHSPSCALVPDHSPGNLRCTTCEEVFPAESVSALVEGRCPILVDGSEVGAAPGRGGETMDRPDGLEDDSYTQLFDLCVERGWKLGLATGSARPDLNPDRFTDCNPHDLVLEVRRPSAPPIALLIPAEDSISSGAALMLERIAEIAQR